MKKIIYLILLLPFCIDGLAQSMVPKPPKLNLDSYLVLMHGIKGNLMQGNFLLYNILGANVDVIDGENLEEIPKHLDVKYNELIKVYMMKRTVLWLKMIVSISHAL